MDVKTVSQKRKKKGNTDDNNALFTVWLKGKWKEKRRKKKGNTDDNKNFFD